MGGGAWRVAAASVIGSDHRRVGGMCQDAMGVRRVMGPAGVVLVLAVADGAGSAVHGGEGAAIAVATTLDIIASQLESGASVEVDGEAVVTAVQAAIDAAASAIDAASRRDFACTLLVAVAGPDSATCLQVGDGAIVVRDPELRLVFQPMRGEFANQTVFVTAPDAARHLQRATGPAPASLALLSAGLESVALDFASGTAFAGFFEPFFAVVAELAPDDAEAERALSAELADFLGSETIDARTGDDRTLVVAVRGKG